MRLCAVCGAHQTEKCHVRDKAFFKGKTNHEFHNIVYLCSYHHHEFFDRERLVYDPLDKDWILLRCIKHRRVEIHATKTPVVIKKEYLEWKNTQSHSFLRAELRKKVKIRTDGP